MNKWITMIVFAGLAACARPAPEQVKAANGPLPLASIHELMDDLVAPAAENVWNATAILTDETGVHDMSPKNDKEWQQLRSQALILVEVPNLLAMKGRKVVPDGETIGAGGTLDAAAIQKRIGNQHGDFVVYAAAFQASAMKAVRAIDARDKKSLDAVGGEIDEVCESCHQQFWYPPAAKKP